MLWMRSMTSIAIYALTHCTVTDAESFRNQFVKVDQHQHAFVGGDWSAHGQDTVL